MNFSHLTKLRLPAILGIAVAAGCLVSGCLSRRALVNQTFALETPSIKSSSTEPKGALAVRSVQVCPLFESREFVYRVGPDRYQTDSYAGFIVSPSRALAIPIRACLRGCGAFQDVVEPGSQRQADTMLEIYASELYGDFRKPDQLAAMLSLRVLAFRNVQGAEQALLSEKEYVHRVPIREQSAAALVAGWNEALADSMKEAIADLTPVMQRAAGQ